MSAFTMQVVDDQGQVAAAWRPGDVSEAEFVLALAARVAAKPVGIFCTRADVQAQVQLALEEYLHELKSRVQPA